MLLIIIPKNRKSILEQKKNQFAKEVWNIKKKGEKGEEYGRNRI
jgi:hypothetical protein